MRAINHALTGAVIGLSISTPYAAVPLAFVSHFALDALPHYGEENADLTTTGFKLSLIADALLCFVLVLLLVVAKPENWLVAAVCAFVATAPDFASIRRYVWAQKGKKLEPQNWFTRFARNIQWGERTWGWIVEAAWFLAMLAVLSAHIAK